MTVRLPLPTGLPLVALVSLGLGAGCAKAPTGTTPPTTAVPRVVEGDGFQDDMAALNITGNFRRIHFAPRSARLDRHDKRELNRAARLLLRHPSVRVVAIGHTDTSGSSAENLALGLARARQVERYLERRGVPADRIMATTAGESAPLVAPGALGTTATHTWAVNRRVEFRVAWDPHDAVDGSEDNLPVVFGG